MGTKLYVGNLNYNTTENSLREAFSANGREVASVSIIMDRETGRPRGFAFVEMATAEGAQQALQELDGADLDGRTLRINEAREREARGPRPFGAPRPDGPAGYGGGYQGRSDNGPGGPPSAPRAFPSAPAPARNFGPPADRGGGRKKEKERGRGDDDRGRRARRRGQGDGGDGW